MDKLIPIFLLGLFRYLHKVWVFFLGIILLVFFFSVTNTFFKDILGVYRICLYIFFVILWSLFWCINRWCLPRNKKGKVGVVIVLYAEGEREEMLVRQDFIRELSQSIKKEAFGQLIDILTVNNHQAAVFGTTDRVKELHSKIKGHFYLYGHVKRREENGSKYFINLNGFVLHKPLDINSVRAFSSDFRNALPETVSFLESMEFQGFQITTDIVYYAVRYVIGTAAFLSGDAMFALQLHSNLDVQIEQLGSLLPSLKHIKERCRFLVSAEAFVIARAALNNGQAQEARNWVNMSLDKNPNNYGGLLLKAILEFSIDGSPVNALKSICKAEKAANNTYEWRYSKAFLFFWIKKYEKALKECKKIVQQSYTTEQSTVNDVISFILDVLCKFPERVDLNYWAGFVYYKKAGNLPKALECFEKLSSASAEYGLLMPSASLYLSEIKREMNIK